MECIVRLRHYVVDWWLCGTWHSRKGSEALSRTIEIGEPFDSPFPSLHKQPWILFREVVEYVIPYD